MSNPIGIGMVGLGWMGTALLKKFHEHPSAKVVAVHQRQQDRAEETLKTLKLPSECYQNSYQDLVDHPEVDAIVLCGTNGTHGSMSIQALNAGKHVFCEKPCATLYEDHLEQIKLDDANKNLITFVDYLMLFDTMEERITELVKQNAFGDISQIQVNYRHPVNISGDKVWKLSKEIMGDAIGMGIIHSLSVMLKIMEAHGTKPIRLYAESNRVHSRNFETDAVWNLMITFDNGAVGTCLGNIDHANGYDAFHNIHGTEGALVFDSQLDHEDKVRLWSNKITQGKWIRPLNQDRCKKEDVAHLAWPKETTTPDSGDVIHHQTHLCVDHFLKHIEMKEKSPLGFSQSQGLGELAWAAQLSAQTHQPVSLPLNQQETLSYFSKNN